MQNNVISTAPLITPGQLLEHWQGHRHLTRRVIETFPEDKLFDYSIGGMRPFSELALELIRLTIVGVHGTVTGQWKELKSCMRAIQSPPPKQASCSCGTMPRPW